MSDLSGTELTSAKVMQRWSGAEIRATRENIYVETANAPSQALGLELRTCGFRKHPDKDVWFAPHNPMNIMRAQGVLNKHFGRAKQWR